MAAEQSVCFYSNQIKLQQQIINNLEKDNKMLKDKIEYNLIKDNETNKCDYNQMNLNL